MTAAVDVEAVAAAADPIFHYMREQYARLVKDMGPVFAQAALLDVSTSVLGMVLATVTVEARQRAMDVVREGALERADELFTKFSVFRAGLEAGRKESA